MPSVSAAPAQPIPDDDASPRLTWSAEDYQGAERADRRTGGRLGATLLLNRNLGLSLIATTLKTASTGRDRAEDFTVNRLSLSLVAQF
jgi:hypothetical protein